MILFPSQESIPPYSLYMDRNDIQFTFGKHVHEYICPAQPSKTDLGNKSVFVGGGISNCPDWQKQFVKLVDMKISKMSATKDSDCQEFILSMLNPRRLNFPIGDPSASEFQIAWEAEYLKQSKAIFLWFPKDSEGPISLFETGKWAMSAKPIFLGIEPGYPRSNELVAQVKSIRPNINIVTTLEEHAANVAKWAMGVGKVDLPVIIDRVIARTIYLAGGIANCSDWQKKMIKLLRETNVNAFNPRDGNYVISDAEEYLNRVRYNRAKLDASEAVLLWFPKEQLTPVALLELGSVVASSKPVFIGIDPGYPRQIDVEIQTKLARPEIDIVYSLEDLAEQVRQYYAMR
jgi:hypothetical protein